MHNGRNTGGTRQARRGRWSAAVAGGLALTLVFAQAALADKFVGTNGTDVNAAATGPSLVFGLGGSDSLVGRSAHRDSGTTFSWKAPGLQPQASQGVAVLGVGGSDIILDDDADADRPTSADGGTRTPATT